MPLLTHRYFIPAGRATGRGNDNKDDSVYSVGTGNSAFRVGQFVRHRFFLPELTPVSSELDQKDATFVLRPGLNGAPGANSDGGFIVCR